MNISIYPIRRICIFICFLTAGLFITSSLAVGSQVQGDLVSYFRTRSIPVTSVSYADRTVVAKLQLKASDDLNPEKFEGDNVTVFSKLAENYPDSSILRLEYSMEGEILNILEIDTVNVQGYSEMDQDRTAMLAHARISIPLALQQRISAEFDSLQARDEASETSTEPSLPERTVDLPDEDVFLGGGGGLDKPSGSWGNLALLFGFLFACLALAYAILIVRGRSRTPAIKIQANLKIFYSNGSTKVFPIREPRILIGRDRSNSLILNDTQVSALHAEIIVIDRSFILQDLQSSNGTRLNGRKILKSPIYLGDEIQVGDTRLILSE